MNGLRRRCIGELWVEKGKEWVVDGWRWRRGVEDEAHGWREFVAMNVGAATAVVDVVVAIVGAVEKLGCAERKVTVVAAVAAAPGAVVVVVVAR